MGLLFRVGIFLFLFLVFGFFIWSILRQRNRLIKKVQELEILLESTLFKERFERKRIAEKLHDGLKNDIIATRNYLTLSETAVSEIDRLTFLKGAKSALNGAFDNSNQLSNQLMPALVRDGNIIKALQSYFKDLQSKTGNSFSVDLKSSEFDLSSAYAHELYNVLVELCENIIAHNTATQIELLLFKQDENIIFELIDNGLQYDFLKCYNRLDGNGLKTIQARLIVLNGTLIQKDVLEGNHLIIKIHN